uniref:Amine oxidase domain-containing protein n=1 Tax=Molossus molossus TaxID=27622 RepID=A0A7J8CRM3_MOLMO|nr:hypothetical protein HJG59_009726 [Molossus molossus]
MATYVDLGGSFVGPTQSHVLRLAKELGLEAYKVNDGEYEIHFVKGKLYKSRGAFPPVWNPIAYLDHNNLWRTTDDMGREIPSEAPWKEPLAEVGPRDDEGAARQDLLDRVCKKLCHPLCNPCVTAEPVRSLLWSLCM